MGIGRGDPLSAEGKILIFQDQNTSQISHTGGNPLFFLFTTELQGPPPPPRILLNFTIVC